MNTAVIRTLKRFRTTVLAAVFAVVSVVGLTADQAHAEFKVCNKTDTMVGVSIGYKLDDEWITEGWWRIPADICTSIIEGDLTTRYFYLNAESDDAEGKWRGPVFMCTSNVEFKIRGVKDCFARGYERTGFFEVDTGKQKSWQVRLTKANQSKKDDSSK